MTTVPESPAQLCKDFVKVVNSFGYRRNRYEVFSDFLEMAYCAVAKTTLPPGDKADGLEDRYMEVVKRHRAEDIREKMPKLLGLTQKGVAAGGDFLGKVSGELEVLNARVGQFFTPFEVCKLMAGINIGDVGKLIEERGFFTLSEPACGAGAMILACADEVEQQGHDPGAVMYVHAVDIAELPFKMAYLQLSFRGIAAEVIRGNSLSLETFEAARTPGMFSFLARHGEAWLQWQREGCEHAEKVAAEKEAAAQAEAEAKPAKNARIPKRKDKAKEGQMSLF